MREMKNSGIEWIGEIPSEWDTMRIKFLADSSVENSFTDGDWIESTDITNAGIRYLTTGNVGDGSFKEQGNSYISVETFRRLNCKYAYPNDLVISRLNSPYGRACILPDSFPEYVLAVDIVILRTNANKQFLAFVTQCSGYQHSVEDQAKGTTMKRISRTNLGNIVIPFPPILEQQRIVGFLYHKCSIINPIIEKTKASIDEYKKLKQAIITQAVTKGVRGNRMLRDSGIQWIGYIPEEWSVYRIGSLYEERREQGNDFLPILTVSINSGVSDRELSDEENDRIFVRSEDKTKYARVYPGDLTYNMMRAWQGAFGAVRVDGMVSPAYVIAKPKIEIDSRYIEALLRTEAAKQEMKRYSYGIADFRLRLYWGYFKCIKVCIPTLEEQKEIADYIDEKAKRIDSLIEKKEAFLEELECYKKSMIYEYVTGKKEVAR